MTNKKLSLVELFRGVPMFAKMLDIMESQRFDALPDPRPDGHNTIIGLMSPLERACSTVLHEAAAKITALGDCRRGHPDVRCLGNIVVELEICPFAKSILAIKAEYPNQSMIRDFMFALITQRMLASYPNIEDAALSGNFVITTSTEMEAPETIEMFEGFEKLSLEEILAISIEGTFLESIIAIVETGEFTDTDSPVTDTEIFVREMTLLEKACWTHYSRLFETKKKLSDERTALRKGDAFHRLGMMITISLGSDDSGAEELYVPTDDNHPDVLRVNKISEELDAIKSKMEPFKTLFWGMINSGISQKTSDEYASHGVRQGFKIVVFNEK